MTPAKLPPPTVRWAINDYWDEAAVLQAVRNALERAAVEAWATGMDEHNKAQGLPCNARTTGSRCAEAIRAIIKEYE